MHTVEPTEETWVRGLGGKWHRPKVEAGIELGYCAWGRCETWLRSVMQISTARPEAGLCKRCARTK